MPITVPVQEEWSYASSVDGTAPLWADVAYAADGRPKPLVVVMHGYSGSRKNVSPDIRDWAARGCFALAPDMRGRGQSAGRWDSGGLDVHDLVDGLLAALARYPAEIDSKNLNLIGYSGGGGNCFAAMVRFPDLFHVIAPFFGISDYGLWFQLIPQYNDTARQAVSGTPDELPHHYAARNACRGAGNNPGAKLHVFWDEKETTCPPVLNERFLETYRAAGLTNAVAHVSRTSDAVRWLHGYRTDHPDLARADDLLAREVLAPVPDLSLPPKGTLTVCGYLVTRRFQVLVEDGQKGVVKVRYDLTSAVPRVDVMENPEHFKVHISPQTPLSALATR